MNLSKLAKTLNKTTQEFQLGSITYNDQEVEFQYKTEMKVDDYEFVFLKESQADNHSTLARRIVKMCRDANGERFDLDDVLKWPIDLVLMVSTKTIPNEGEEEAEKKKPSSSVKK